MDLALGAGQQVPHANIKEEAQASILGLKQERNDLSLSKPASNDFSKLKPKVINKERTARCALNSFKSLLPQISNISDDIPVFQQFQEEIEEICNLEEIARVSVGIFGTTGCGKSTLINTLLGEKKYLPTSAMEASTSVIIEVAYNKSDVPEQQLCAEIVFIDQNEWQDEIRHLHQDVVYEFKNSKEGEIIGTNPDSLTAQAMTKLAAVYPDLKAEKLAKMKVKDVLKINPLSDVLGKITTIHEPRSNINKFHKRIKAYTDSGNSSCKASAYWPLVKLVKLYLKCPLLATGLVLVDLPGLGDSNSARGNVALNYMSSLDHIWIAADIVRAVDENIAKELLGKSFKRQLAMDGKCSAITFIMTKIDSVVPQEIIDSRGLSSTSLKSELGQLRKLDKERKRVNDQLQQESKESKSNKRKRSDSTSPCQQSQSDTEMTTSERLKNTFKQLSQQRNDLNTLITKKCIDERNTYTQARISEQYEQGFIELDEECIREENDSLPPILQDNLPKKLNIFCVSSRAYRKLKGWLPMNQEFPAFNDLDSTNIPNLRDYAIGLARGKNGRIVENIITRYNILRPKLIAWAVKQDIDIPLSLNQIIDLRQALNTGLGEFRKACEKVINKLITNMRSTNTRKIGNGIVKIDLAKWIEDTILSEEFSIIQMPVGTFKATLRRDGVNIKKGRKTINWNNAFADLHLKPITKPWKDIFQNKMVELHDACAQELKRHLHEFSVSYQKSLLEHDYMPGIKLIDEIPFLEPLICEKVERARIVFNTHARKTRQAVEPMMKKMMLPIYKECLQY
ncbi:hypothetical protein BJ875DRAFT_16569 [Amylocarpus encephaloides]|uniref:Dynamin N-terminal domain-containing protein n=1 Tax=Amylocarpus encephaloides TaxID=45428 RepID=A0A9P8C5L3_9HELO|nr:hypothetical protein BJ875DRAFT_16569 [Amylocarpus encephaloides]